ncbi:MAG: gliding motility-associated C-terminal domain-containing protein [Flavobacteriales bacterium]
MKRLLLLLSIFFSHFFIQGQELINNNWTFYEGLGITFNTTPPSYEDNGNSGTEGPETMSDSLGNILFYSSEGEIKMSNHFTMPNGTNIKGHRSCMGYANTTCWPGNPDKYIYFSADAREDLFAGDSMGLHYSVIDMSLNGGLGDVELATKNTVLISSDISERIIIGNHSNGLYKWLIVRMATGNAFHAYLIDETGVNHTPVVSNVGWVFPPPTSTYRKHLAGNLKFNKTMDKMAEVLGSPWTSPLTENVLLMDFDASTGVLSNPVGWYKFENFNQLRDVEFSPNGEVLYVSSQRNGISQFDITSNNSVTIKASETIVVSDDSSGSGLQIGPDDIVYFGGNITKLPPVRIGCFKNPNVLGFGCNPDINSGCVDGVTTGSLTSAQFPKTKYTCNTPLRIFASDTCEQSDVEFGFTFFEAYDSVRWEFGDPSSGMNTSTDSNAVHYYEHSGLYLVNFQLFTNGLVLEDTLNLMIFERPDFDLGDDTVLCGLGSSIQLEVANDPHTVYTWNTGDQTNAIEVTTSGTYILEATSTGGCYFSDTIEVTLEDLPQPDLGQDIQICEIDTPIVLNANINNASYLWNTGEQTETIEVNEFGTYWVEVEKNGCFNTDSIRIDSTVNIDYGDWESSIEKCFNDTIKIGLNDNPNYTYEWNTGDLSSSIEVVEAGLYSLTIRFEDCALTEEINITNKICCETYWPNAFSPDEDGENDVFFPKSDCELGTLKIEIYDRWGKKFYTSNDVNFQWDGYSNSGEKVQIGIYTYIAEYTYKDINGFQKRDVGSVILIR